MEAAISKTKTTSAPITFEDGSGQLHKMIWSDDQYVIQRHRPEAVLEQNQWKPISYHSKLRHATAWILDYILKTSNRTTTAAILAEELATALDAMANIHTVEQALDILVQAVGTTSDESYRSMTIELPDGSTIESNSHQWTAGSAHYLRLREVLAMIPNLGDLATVLDLVDQRLTELASTVA